MGDIKRPLLLTVLCLLSFIGAGIWLVTDIIKYWSGHKFLPLSPEQAFFLNSMILLDIVCTLFGMVGVVMIWKLKKAGLFLYAIASLVGSIAPIVSKSMVRGLDTSPRVTIGGLETKWMGLIVTLIFIVLYGMNLKEMPKKSDTVNT